MRKRTRNARRFGRSLRRARLRHLDGQFPRYPGGPRGQQADLRLPRAQDPPARQGSGGRRKANPQKPWLWHAPCAAESGYFEVYNQPNVKLVDINETPIECITPSRIKTSDAEYKFDIIIYATGLTRLPAPSTASTSAGSMVCR